MTAVEPVTLYVVCYGDTYEAHLPQWVATVERLNPAPADVVVITDRQQDAPFRQVVAPRQGRYPFSSYFNVGVAAASTEHVAVVGVDDELMSDALAGTDYDADVFIWGLERSDGLLHIQKHCSAEELLMVPYNPYNQGGVHTVDIWRKAGGFRDVGYSDWAFFVDCARVGATFAVSGRVNYRYQWHPHDSISGQMSPDHEFHAAEAKDLHAGRLL